MKIHRVLLLSVLAVIPVCAQQLGPAEIIARSVEVTQRDWDGAVSYDYYEREQNVDTTKTYHVVMLEGSPYNRLVAINDHPLSAEDEATAEERFTRTASERQRESSEAREGRIARYRNERERDRVLMTEITRALEFTLAGRETFKGHDVYVLKGTPRRRYRPPNEEAKALTGMRGTLWIDAVNFHWVKAEAEVVNPVWMKGFVARLQPGTRFVLEQMPAADGLWMPQHYAMQARAKVLFLFAYNSQEESTYFGYHKRGAEPAHVALGEDTHDRAYAAMTPAHVARAGK